MKTRPGMVVLWQSAQLTIRWSLVQTLVKDWLNPPPLKMPAFADQKVHMKDPARVQQIVNRFVSDGPKKLQVITDFDMTLTRFSCNGKRCPTCHNVIESCRLMTEESLKQMVALKSTYYPIEIDPNLSAEEKTPYMVSWWSQSHNIMIEMKIRKDMLAKVVKESDIKLRDGHERFFGVLRKLGVSVFVFSAGVGDVLEHVLSNAGAMHPNVHVVSNYMDFDDEGILKGFKGELIHTYNKHEGARYNADYFERQRDCTNIILMGDSMGDVRMADGVPHVDNKLTIGFLNDKSEWYELQEKEQLGGAQLGTVPDVYVQNQELHDKITCLHRDLAKFQETTRHMQDTLVTLRKERDHHRMRHQRVLQEKSRLLNDLKRLQKHYASYEPALRSLREKYEAALKEKMLTKLERDRAVGQISGLQATLHNLESGLEEPAPIITGFHDATESGVEGPSQRRLREARQQSTVAPADEPAKSSAARHPKDSEFPVDTRVNPLLGQVKKQPSHTMRSGSLRVSHTLTAHDLPISSMVLHPRKEILVTASDDQLWKMWSIPNGDIIMTGEGHTDWIGGCDFNPTGTNLATGGGDSTVKVWDFLQGTCVLTLEGHGHAVWGCSWHSCGDFIASSSMDNSSKVWDVNSERCRQTLRGHTDSVNSVEFLPFSNTLLTSSADKTLSLWDARTGRCAQMFYGHLYSCNHGTFNLKGDTVASCDSYGVIKVWDVRKGTATMTLNLGPHPANRLSFHPSGHIMAVASDDGCVRMVELSTGHVETLSGHEGAVQTVVFSLDGEMLYSGGSDGTVRMWE